MAEICLATYETLHFFSGESAVIKLMYCKIQSTTSVSDNISYKQHIK
jgi:hypothetical protein